MDKKPWWSFDRSYRVVYAFSCIVVFFFLLVHDLSTGDKSSFILGSSGYWVFTTPFIVVIALIGGVILLGVYAVFSHILLRLMGHETKSASFDMAITGGGYIALCLVTFALSKSTGQPDSQAILAAIFLAPVLGLFLYGCLVVIAALVVTVRKLIGGIRILP